MKFCLEGQRSGALDSAARTLEALAFCLRNSLAHGLLRNQKGKLAENQASFETDLHSVQSLVKIDTFLQGVLMNGHFPKEKKKFCENVSDCH